MHILRKIFGLHPAAFLLVVLVPAVLFANLTSHTEALLDALILSLDTDADGAFTDEAWYLAAGSSTTLDSNADTILSLTVQEIGLDTQIANRVLAGPTSGDPAVPTVRALVDADVPDTITVSAYVPKAPACLTAAPGSPASGQIECADGNNWQINASQGTDDWLVRYRTSDTTWVGFYNITTGIQIVSQIDETVPIADGDGTGSLLWAFAFGAQRIITVPGDAAQTLATLEAGNVFTGANDFGGATSVEVPNGANPTTDAAGEIAVDTSTGAGQGVRVYGAIAATLPLYQTRCQTWAAITASNDNSFTSLPYNITVRAVRVVQRGATNVIGHLDECDSAGASCAGLDGATDITATTTQANDDGSLSNATVDANDVIQWHTTSVSGTNTDCMVCMDFSVDQVN